jgi:hypothetical protein
MNRPFFIVGSPRAGTTLLSRILDHHSRIAVYHESHYYPLFRPQLHRYGDLRLRQNLVRLINDVREVTRVQGFLEPPSVADFTAALPAPTFEGVLAALLALHARKQGKARAADKTPEHHAYLAEILEKFPASPVIFLLRDPRDAIRSMRLALGCSVKGGAWMWNAAFVSYRKYSARVHLVRYENLAREPRQTLEAVSAALGENFEPGMLRFFDRIPGTLAARPNFKKLLKDVDAESVGKFHGLPDDDIRRIEQLCAEGMEALGYAFTAGRPKPVAVAPPPRLLWAADRLRYYGVDPSRWRRGWMRWKILLRLRLRDMLSWNIQ